MSINNYTLLDEVLKIGGELKSTKDFSTGEYVSLEPSHAGVAPCGVRDVRDKHFLRSLQGGLPLSTSHNSPFIEYTSGASLLKVSGGGNFERHGGGKRDEIKGFSDNSRRYLMRTIARIRTDAELPNFITLTYPSYFPEPKESKKHLDIFLKRFRRAFPNVGGIWKLEPQERGAPHYHILAWGASEVDMRLFVPFAWHAIAGNGDENHLAFHLGALHDTVPCVNQVRSWRGVWSYASKYLGKTFQVAGWDSKKTGRFWGVFNRPCVPFGQDMVMRITLHDAHKWMRYQRRFSGIRFRSSTPSHTIFCDANQWVKNIINEHGGELSQGN